MTIALYLLLAALLILLNAFFVLAEFAIVKVRPSRIETLAEQGNARAALLQKMQSRMDEYLSVCQVGITFASIGLGFVGEPAFAGLILRLTNASSATAHTVAVTLSYLVVSSLHIVIGEQVPKSIAIRRSEQSSLFSARPMRFFHVLFYPPLVILNTSANFCLRLLGFHGKMKEAHHSEDELRLILEQSQTMGMMSFRRLLLLENVFDLGDLKVRDAMRQKAQVRLLRTDAPWADTLKTIREARFSRYPLIDQDPNRPVGVVHVKDLLLSGESPADVDLRKIARPILTTTEDTPLEMLLADLQKRHGHVAVVTNAKGIWTGFISLEDVVEEIIGMVEDEFELEVPMYLADSLTPARIVLGLQSATIEEAIRLVISTVPAAELPLPVDRVTKAVLDRERVMSTYLGRGVSIPHARFEEVTKPVLIFARSERGIPVPGREDKAYLLFFLLTPASTPRVQARLLANIGGLMESEYVEDRLRQAKTPQDVFEAIRTGEIVARS